jgi:hypothetical protein
VKNLSRELSERDLWSEIAANRASLTIATNGEANSLFESNEQKRIQETLVRVEKEIMRSNRLSIEQTRLLHEKLDLIREASSRRADWIGRPMRSGL